MARALLPSIRGLRQGVSKSSTIQYLHSQRKPSGARSTLTFSAITTSSHYCSQSATPHPNSHCSGQSAPLTFHHHATPSTRPILTCGQSVNNAKDLLRYDRSRSTHKLTRGQYAEYIRNNTEITRTHLTPELQLHLVTPECNLWTAREEDCLVSDPYWAFYWPGGQALTRYILDNPELVTCRTVVDVGSGCGASAIACAIRGAAVVTASDICPVAATAIALNASLNHVTVDVTTSSLIGVFDPTWDTILLGDMFYDEEFTNTVSDWLSTLHDRKRTVLIGDPGRLQFISHPMRNKLKLLAQYELLPSTKQENNGFTHGYVWTFM